MTAIFVTQNPGLHTHATMTRITIDLNQNPEVKDLAASMQPGDRITLETSIQAKDDQTLTLTLDTASAGGATDDDGEDLVVDEAPTGILPDEA